MTDCHIHIERGEYTKAWLERFIETAVSRNIDEIWLL
jgi:histidinol-phosphatase (PHP family)